MTRDGKANDATPTTIQPHHITGLGAGGTVTRSPIFPSGTSNLVPAQTTQLWRGYTGRGWLRKVIQNEKPSFSDIPISNMLSQSLMIRFEVITKCSPWMQLRLVCIKKKTFSAIVKKKSKSKLFQLKWINTHLPGYVAFWNSTTLWKYRP